MIADKLIISDIQADLIGDSPIALTYQVNDLASFKDRQSLYSQSIKLPLTSNNVAIWGYPNIDSFTQIQPYRKLACKLYRAGVELIPNGLISLLNVTDNQLECQITYGITGFADALKINVQQGGVLSEIKDATLKDLDWSDIPPFAFDLPTVAASQENQNPLWAIIDYGDTLGSGATATMQYLRPGILYSQIFDRITRLTGYKLQGGKAFTDGMADYLPFSDSQLYNQFGQNYQSGDLLSVENNLPDFTVKDILTDFMSRYFLTPVVDNLKKTIVFKSFDDLYNNKQFAKDWTNKFIDNGATINFKFGEYAQNNNLTWENDGFFITPGQYIITIANQNLDTSKTIFQSPLASSENVSKIGGKQVAQIKKLSFGPTNPNEPYTIETKPRVVRIETYVGNFAITNGTTNVIIPQYKLGRFMNWQELSNTYGQGFLKLINKARSIDTNAIIVETDLLNFDHFIPVYNQREGKYYYINKLSNFISGKTTSVSLIRM